MKKGKNPKRRVSQQGGKGMTAQVQTSVEIISLATVICKCSERDYERLFIRDPEVKAREGKMAYVRPEYHDRIMRIIRVIGHDRLNPVCLHRPCADASLQPVRGCHKKPLRQELQFSILTIKKETDMKKERRMTIAAS